MRMYFDRIKRIVPRENEAINETWISDRDRFSYEGIYSPDRLKNPKLKVKNEWKDIPWEQALNVVVEQINATDKDQISLLASPSSTTEEFYLLSKIAQDLSVNNLDHRLRRTDFSDQDNDPVAPWLGTSISEIENCKSIVLVGSEIRKETPIIAHRIKSALNGSQVSFINSQLSDYFFDVSSFMSGDILESLCTLVGALKIKLSNGAASIESSSAKSDDSELIAKSLSSEGDTLILLGHEALNHPQSSTIRCWLLSSRKPPILNLVLLLREQIRWELVLLESLRTERSTVLHDLTLG